MKPPSKNINIIIYTMPLSPEEYFITDWVGFSFGLLSLLLSVLTLYIIYRMCKNNVTISNRTEVESLHNSINSESVSDVKIIDSKSPSFSDHSGPKFSGYLLLIVSMAVCQILYDLSYILRVVKQYPNCLVSYFLTWLGGLSVAIWSNILSFIIFYVVTKIKSVEIFRYYPFFFCLAVGGPLIFAVAQVSMRENFVNTGGKCSATGYTDIFIAIYYWARIVSIVLNAVVFIRISIRLRYLSKLPQSRDPSANDATPALLALIRRIKYYPLIQVFIRSGATWNEYNDNQYQTLASQLMNSICSPSSGACYFILFLYMQPRAYKVFCNILRSWFCCSSEEDTPPENEQRLLIADDFFQLDEDDLNDLDEDALEKIINLNGNHHPPGRSFGSFFMQSASFASVDYNNGTEID